MSYELDPNLRQRAETILKTNSERVGPLYWRSRVKRALDIFLSAPASPAALAVMSLGGA